MNYLDERGHKQNWSVFSDGKIDGEIFAHEMRVELSGHFNLKKTSNTKTVLFDYLQKSRNMPTADVVTELSTILDIESLPAKWGDEIEAIATSVHAMRERVLAGKFDPMLELGPQNMANIVFKRDRIPAIWELDLVTYCPSMYYFYMFYFLLPYKNWIIKKENVTEPTRYIPTHKTSFMGRTPLPVWRTQFSSKGIQWLESKIGDKHRELDDKERELLSTKVERLRVSPAEKNALKILLQKMSEQPGGFKLKPAGLNTSKKYWRPFLISQATSGPRIIPYKLRPHQNFPYTHLKKFNHYQIMSCSESSGFYEDFNLEEYPRDIDDAISALTSYKEFKKFCAALDFKKIAWDNELCEECGYRSLCGIWGF